MSHCVKIFMIEISMFKRRNFDMQIKEWNYNYIKSFNVFKYFKWISLNPDFFVYFSVEFSALLLGQNLGMLWKYLILK